MFLPCLSGVSHHVPHTGTWTSHLTPAHGSHKTIRYFAGGAESLTREGLMEITCSYQAHFLGKAGKSPSMAD